MDEHHDKLIQERNEQLAEMANLLGMDVFESAILVVDAVDKMKSRIAELQEKARKWDDYEQLQRGNLVFRMECRAEDLVDQAEKMQSLLGIPKDVLVPREPLQSVRAIRLLEQQAAQANIGVHAKCDGCGVVETFPNHVIKEEIARIEASAPKKPTIAELCPGESGKGLRDGSGKYTEPGEPIIYLDTDWD